MTTLVVSVPDEFLELLGSEENAKEHLTRAAVLDLVKRQVISQGRGAELLDMDPWDFRELMADANVPTVDLTARELREGHLRLKEALSAESG